MTFDPFYDVYSTPYLVTFFCFAFLETLLCSGITYGWASLVVVFKEEHFYLNLCKEWFHAHNKTINLHDEKTVQLSLGNLSMVKNAAYFNDGKIPGCPIQDERLNLVLTCALFCLCGVKFPAGVFIDKCGPRIARTVGGIIYILACLGLGFIVIGYENLLFPVFAMISMGGSLLVVAVYQVANIVYRSQRSRVICILHGAFDSSSVVLLLFKLIHDKGISLRNVMLGYSILCLILITVGTVFLTPPLSVLFHWVDEENEINQNCTDILSMSGPDFAVNSLVVYKTTEKGVLNYGSNDNSLELDQKKCEKEDKFNLVGSGEDNSMHSQDYNDKIPLVRSIHNSTQFSEDSVFRSIFSFLYIFELVFLTTFQLKLWYFVGSIADMLGRLALNDKDIVSSYINLFGYIQFGGMFVTPIIAFVFAKNRLSSDKDALLTPPERRIQRLRECILPIVITNFLCFLFCILSLIEDIRVQVPLYLLYTTVRGFLYSNHGAFMGSAFPASQFGTLYGLGIFIGGTFGILQYALFELTSKAFNGDHFWVNMILLVLVLIANLHPLYLWWYCKKQTKLIHEKPQPAKLS